MANYKYDPTAASKAIEDISTQGSLNLGTHRDLYKIKQDEQVKDGDTIGGGRFIGYDTFESFTDSDKSRKLLDIGISAEKQKELGNAGKSTLSNYLKENVGKVILKHGVDVFGRDLLQDPKLAETMVRSGNAVPTDRYDEKLQALHRATTEKLRALDPAKATALDLQREYNIERQNPGILGSIKNIPSALGSATQQLVAGIGDFALDVVTPGDNTWLNNAKSAKSANKNFGYDGKEAHFRQAEAVSNFHQGKYGQVASDVLHVVPELLAESVPTIASYFIPVVGEAKMAVWLGKTAQYLEKAKGTKDAADSMYKLANFARGNLGGFALNVGAQTNTDIDEFTKNNNGQAPDPSRIALMTANNTLQMGTDKFIDFSILKGKDLSKVVDTMQSAARVLPEKSLIDIGKRVGTVAAKLAITAGEEGAQEYYQQWAQILNQKLGTTKYGNLDNLLNSKEVTDEALGAGLMGAGMGVAMTTPRQTPTALGAAYDLATMPLNAMGMDRVVEQAKARFGSTPGEAAVEMPKTYELKKAMWDDVDRPDFAVEGQKAKDAYTSTIAQYVVDTLMSPEKLQASGYKNANLEGLYTDGAAKIAKVNGLSTEKDKTMIQYMIAMKLAQYTHGKDGATGRDMLNPEQKTGLLQSVSNYVKGNKPAESALLESQKDRIKSLFDEAIEDTKSSNITYALEMFRQEEDSQVLAKLATMSKDQYDNLLTAVRGMKVLGSKEALEDSTEIENTIERMRDYATKVLGSKEDAKDGKPIPVKRRTFEEVSNDVETMGFLGDSNRRKSIKAHTRDMEDYVGTGVDQAKEDKVLKQLQFFVDHRGLDKVHTHSTDYSEGNAGGKRLNLLKGIRDVVTSKINENDKLINALKNAETKQWKAVTESKKETVSELLAELMDAQKDHQELLGMIDSKDQEVRKSVYAKLNKLAPKSSNKPDKNTLDAVLESMKDEHTGIYQWDLEPGDSQLIDFHRLLVKVVEGNKSVDDLMKAAEELAVNGLDKNADSIVSDTKNKINILTRAIKMLEEKEGVDSVIKYLKKVRQDYASMVSEIPPEVPTRKPIVDGTRVTAEDEGISDYAKAKEGEIELDIQDENYDPASMIEPIIPVIRVPIKNEKPAKAKVVVAPYKGPTSSDRLKKFKNVIVERILVGDNYADTFDKRKSKVIESINKNEGMEKALKDHLIEYANSLVEEDIETVIGSLGVYLENIRITVENPENLAELYASNSQLIDTLQSYYEKLAPIRATRKAVVAELREKRAELKVLIGKLEDKEKVLKEITKTKKELKKDSSWQTGFKQALRSLVGSIGAAVRWIKAYTKFIVEKRAEIEESESVLRNIRNEENKIRLQILRIRDNIDEVFMDIRRADKQGFIEKAKERITRGLMERELTPLVKQNKSTDNSIAMLITKGASVATMMEIMPRVVTNKKEYGEILVKMAVDTLNEFAKKRLFGNKVWNKETKVKEFIPESAIQQFIKQGKVDNPLMEIEVNGETVSFMDMLTSNEQIAEHVLTAMNMSSIVILKDMLDTKTLNSDAMDKLIKGSFPSVLIAIDNLPEQEYSYDVKKFMKMDAKQQMKELIAEGHIVPESTFIDDAGRFMWEQLELKFAESGVRMLDQDKLITALGAMVINNLLPVERDQNNSHNVISRQILRFDTRDPKQKAVTVNLDRIEGSPGHRVIDISKLRSAYKFRIRDAAKAFEYASSRNVSMISDKPIKAPTQVNNGVFDHSEPHQDYLDAQGAIEWKFMKGFGELYEGIVEKVKEFDGYTEATKKALVTAELVKAIIGEELALTDLGPHDFKSALAKYEAEKLVIERMGDVFEMVGYEGFYIGWNSTVAGRSMMDSTLVNMQASGISRFIVHSKGMVNDIDTKNITKAQLDHLELAVAQALDIDPAKKDYKVVLGDLHEKFVQIVKTTNGLELKFVNDSKSVLKALVTKDKFELGDIRQLTKDMMFENDQLEVGLEIKSKSIMHTYQAVELLRKIYQSGTNGTTVSTTLALEADGITNGMALILQQLGINEFTLDLLARAGVYLDESTDVSKLPEGVQKMVQEYIDKKYTNHGQYKDAGNKDIYEAPIDKIQTALGKQLLDTLNDTLKDSEGKAGNWRNLLKEPVMTFIYGSGMSTIRENLARSLVLGNSYMSGGLSRGRIAELGKLAGMDLEVTYKKYVYVADKDNYELVDITKAELDEMEDSTKAKFAYMEEEHIVELIRKIDAAIGEKFATAFEDRFEQIIKFRQVVKAIEQVNYAYFGTIFNDKIKKTLGTRLVTGAISDLTQEELLAIRKEMIADDTWYSAKGAEGTNVDYFKKQKSKDNNPLNEVISVSINTGTYRSQTGYANKYNVPVQQITSNVGAVVVTTTHNQDGSVMIITGKASDVLNIYDAVLMGTNLESNTEMVQSMNKAFYRVGMEQSMIGTAITKMMHMKKMVGDTPLDAGILYESFSNLQRIFNRYDSYEEAGSGIRDTLLDKVAEVVAQVQKIDADRELYKQVSMRTNQYTAASDIEGVVNKIDESIKFAKTLPEDVAIEEVESELIALVNNAVDSVDSIRKEQERKDKAKGMAKAFGKMMTDQSELYGDDVYNAIREILGIEKDAKVSNRELLGIFMKTIEITC